MFRKPKEFAQHFKTAFFKTTFASSSPLSPAKTVLSLSTEKTAERLVLKSGSTTLTLDKRAGKGTLQRKFLLLWGLKPVETPLSEIADVSIDTAVDRASGPMVSNNKRQDSHGSNLQYVLPDLDLGLALGYCHYLP